MGLNPYLCAGKQLIAVEPDARLLNHRLREIGGDLQWAGYGVVEAHIGGHLVQHFQSRGPGFQRETVQQKVVADRVDEAGNALGPQTDFRPSIPSENTV